MKNENGPTLADIIAAQLADESPEHDPWPTITPEEIAVWHVRECWEQLDRVGQDVMRLALAAKAAHLALQAALTGALAGSMGIGAYNKQLELKWLRFLQEGAESPRSRRVMDFDALLAKAMTQKLEWTQDILEVSDQDADALKKLTQIRHGIEHPKPGFWVIEPSYIYAVIPVAIRLTVKLLNGLFHHFEPGDLEKVGKLASEIEIACSAGAAC